MGDLSVGILEPQYILTDLLVGVAFTSVGGRLFPVVALDCDGAHAQATFTARFTYASD